MTGPKRVMIVSNMYPPHVLGGAEIVAHRQAMQLRDRGYQVSVFAGWVAPPDRAASLNVEEVDGLRVYRTPVASFDPDDSFRDPGIAARFRAVLRVERPDLVHFHNLLGLGFSLIPVAHRLGLPSVVTLHDHAGYCVQATALRPDGTVCGDTEACAIACRGSIQPRDLDRALPMRLRRDYVAWALGHADRLISPSAYLAAAYRAAGAVDSERLGVISNGIDLAPFDDIMPRPHDRAAYAGVRFFCAAYLGPHKGIPELLEAAASLASRPELSNRWTLAIAGDGGLHGQIAREIDQGRFGRAVTLLGRVPRSRVIEELSAADVVVLPSRWPENEPVIMLEAIAAGRAQLATDIGGMPELVEAGVTGDLVPPADPAALAAAMAAYIRDPERARRQGQASWERRGRLSETAAIDAIEALYAEIIADRQAPGPREPLVLCAGDWPTELVATTCNLLHRREGPGRRVRLAWHSWVEPEIWQNAALLWNWSANADQVLVQRALRSGVAILAPADCAMASGVVASFGGALAYETIQQASEVLGRLSGGELAVKAGSHTAQIAADIIAGNAPAVRYHLPTPSIAA